MRARLDLSALPRTPAPVLDADQGSVVAHTEGPLLVLAGPGTGKTTTIVESVVARVTEGWEPESVLVLTFGRRAAGEVRDRIAARLGGGLLPTVSTFHSFAYGLLRSLAPQHDYLEPPRLLSGAEEDQRIRELIAGSVEDGSIAWPENLREALLAQGFAAEVRAFIALMRERGMSADQVRALARTHDRPEWSALAELAEQEENVMVLQNVMDYTELMRRAVIRAGDPLVQADLHRRFRAIYVDEFQDTDPLQVELLSRIAGPECVLVAVGDPDQAIYAFRGADVHGILDFPERFPRRDGSPAPIIALRSVRRYGQAIADIARAVLAAGRLGTLPVEAQRAHRSPHILGVDHDGAVEVLTSPTRAARDTHIAEQIRWAHVHDRVAWHDMAVLVRSSDDLAAVERALSLAGVPASVTADEVPLHAEPAVAQLLLVVEIAARPSYGSPERIEDLLLGPIGRIDVSDLRRLGRALRAARRDSTEPMVPARELIRELVLGNEPWPDGGRWGIDPASEIAAGVRRVRSLLAAVSERIDSGASIGEVLWEAWTGGRSPHHWPERLRDAALAGSVSADHDLDAVMALFDSAERLSERYRGVYAVTTFLATLRDQAIPAESIAESRSDANRIRPGVSGFVPIMTVHRAKGLEWARVWITGLEEGIWPNVRPRGSLLGIEQLAYSDDRSPDLVREERNLLFVACTRARDQVRLMAIDADEQGEERPSRFLADASAAGFSARALTHRPQWVSSWSGLVADMRRALMDPKMPQDARDQAASVLAAIARQRDASGMPLVPAADPATWWGIGALSQGPRPLRDREEPIALSGSSLDSIRQCSMSWFLDHEVHAEVARSSATAFGSIVHAIADHVAQAQVPADIEAMDALVDDVWTSIGFEAPWRSVSERTEARRALERFLRYHLAHTREFVESEKYLESILTVPTPDGSHDRVHIRGFLDRIEKDDQGRWVAIDLKTSSSFPSQAETDEHGQLGLYQLLLRDSYSEDGDHHGVGGAALVQLRKDTDSKNPAPREQFQQPLGESAASAGTSTWIEGVLGEAAQIVRGENVVARPGQHCRYCDFAQLCPAKNPQVSLIDLDGEATDDFEDES